MKFRHHVGFGWISQRSGSRPRVELHALADDGTWREIARFERLEGRGWFYVVGWAGPVKVGPFRSLLLAVTSSGVRPALRLIKDRSPVRISGAICL